MNMRGFTILSILLTLLVCVSSCKDWSKVEIPKGEAFNYIRFLHKLEDAGLDESSGLVMDKAGFLWSHNDSQGEPVLFRFDAQGKSLGKVTLSGVENVDWEDLSLVNYEGQEFILQSDIGNNWHRRDECPLYLIPTTGIGSEVNVLRTFTVSFGGESINCESVAYDDATDTLYLVEKNYDESARLYFIESFMAGDDKREAVELCRLDLEIVTAMDLKGSKAAILTPKVIHYYEKGLEQSWQDVFTRKSKKIALPEILPQAEGLCFSHDTQFLLMSSETDGHGLDLTQIYKIDLKAAL